MLEYGRRVRAGDSNAEIFLPEGEGTFVASETDVVTTADDLLELVSAIGGNWLDECTYTGRDHLSVDVYRARLPENYCGRVVYIQMQHIPEPHFRRGEVLPQVDNGQLYMAAPRIMPVWTTRSMVSYFGGKRFETSEEVIIDNYHFITFKIRKEDGSLKSWSPGVDKDTGLCKTLAQQYVLVGN